MAEKALTKKDVAEIVSRVVDDAIEIKIKPFILQEIQNSEIRILEAIENFMDEADIRFIALEYDLRKMKKDVEWNNKRYSLAHS